MKGLEKKPGGRSKKTPPTSPLPAKREGTRGRGKEETNSFIRHLAQAGKKNPPLRELMQFYQELLKLCTQNPPTFSVEAKFLKDKILAAKGSANPPLLKIYEFPLDQEAAENLFGRLLLWLLDRPRTSAEAKKIAEAWQQEKLSLAKLFRHALARDENYFKNVALPLNLKEPLLFFLSFNSVRPAVETLAKSFRPPREQNQGCSCPLCGSAPAMAQLRGEEGARYFYCSFCGTQWPGKRLICPYCQNQDQESLRYFTVENEKSCSVYVCELCKKYIKTMNSRETPAPILLFIADLVTPHLDIMAAQEGYQRGTHNLFALQIS